ncbi:MAG TPA: hypothetical protein VJY85_03120, partial [Candidatus Limnocylindria bacterium]|nr:hypothetical protein [Candidatus Limnocylindria bacterium]
DDRPLHAGALAEALRDWIAGDHAPALAMAPHASGLDAAETQAVPVVRPAALPATPRRRPPYPVAILAGMLLVVVALAGIGLAVSGGLPALGEAPSATPSARVTPIPTPSWRPALLAAYRDGCGASLDRSELQGLSRNEAEAMVAEAVQDCQHDEDRGKGKGKGPGHGGNGGGGKGGKGPG